MASNLAEFPRPVDPFGLDPKGDHQKGAQKKNNDISGRCAVVALMGCWFIRVDIQPGKVAWRHGCGSSNKGAGSPEPIHSKRSPEIWKRHQSEYLYRTFTRRGSQTKTSDNVLTWSNKYVVMTNPGGRDHVLFSRLDL